MTPLRPLAGRAKRLIYRYFVLPVRERSCRNFEDYVDVILRTPFAPIQNVGEIAGLMSLLSTKSPERLLEIGTGRGGVVYLLAKVAHPQAVIATIDISPGGAKLIRSFASRQQQIRPIIGDSASPDVLTMVSRLFPDGLDFLFIDGDHTYEGVQRDFDNYSPLVRPGGLVAFHDIIEDTAMRTGTPTGAWVGDVPRFWRDVESRFETTQLVDDETQDGRGIGVIFK